MATKMTVVEHLRTIANLDCMAQYPEHKQFLLERADLTAKKNAGVNKKKQAANDLLLTALMDNMVVNQGYTVSALVGVGVLDDKGAPLTAPKVTSLLQHAIAKENPMITRHVEKNVALYTKVR